MADVTILLSTYNGEKYLEEQLESIVSQRDISPHLVIRDDGSKDGTLKMIRAYAEKYPFISYYTGENLGATGSFFDLIKNAGKSDYYAFSDQDDVWDEDKLIAAVSMLEAHESEPAMYYSNLRITDENLNFIRLSHTAPHVLKNRNSAVIRNMATGCTVVYNRALQKLVMDKDPSGYSGHDEWLFAVASYFGKTVYDFEPHISYRLHGTNEVGTYGKKSISGMLRRFSELLELPEDERLKNTEILLDNFGELLTDEDRRALETVSDYKKSPASACRLLLSDSLRTGSAARNLAAFIRILERKF